ncbi:phosphoribosylanthranilate isomerase [Limibaculum sp. FT325]|uniref:phosphoribosylanthranilate isomerase n=1 Tax=Thermohalobaculum sediminis TaxID=2939436 RepID=UPI0020BDB3FF|nr:phosphoribosylanthranilate isomerase [Limibaculum sediminis]MCL5775948.1 phosphoribosylanthranilate isomerase [Limibaculum sediminis]
MRLRLKICCIASPDEARLAARMGADLLGLVGPMPTGPGVIDLASARAIAVAAPPWARPVLLSSEPRTEGIARDAAAAGVDAVQIVRHVEPSEHDRLARLAPRLARIQVIHVEDRAALDLIPAYAGRAAAFLLDSGRPGAAELGGTGRVHDWEISAEFVRRSPLPVFLAGGLGPANAAEAVARVRPFGLDICSGVRTDGALDAGKLAAFIAAAQGVA